MKVLILLFLCFTILYTEEYVLQAEDGTLSSSLSVLTNISGYTGTGYVGNFENSNDTLYLNFTTEKNANYSFIFHYAALGPENFFEIYVNSDGKGEIELINSNTFQNSSESFLSLIEGENTIEIVASRGLFVLDCIYIKKSIAHINFSLPVENPVNPAISQEAKELYNYFRSIYGNYIVSGHTHEYYKDFTTYVGKKPAIVSFDFGSYSPMYPYDLKDGKNVFGPVDNGQVDSIIEYYKNTTGNQIITIQWVWYSPSGGSPGIDTFKRDYTTFNVSLAVQEGTKEYNETIRDLDAIAEKLKILQDESIPILWRPLHESDNEWLWYGAEGKEPAVTLWRMMYDRFTNYHKINNLLWVYTRANENSCYPGDDYVDIFGLYNYIYGHFDYRSRETDFVSMYKHVEGKKMIAMPETGCFPDIDGLIEENAMWLYVATWGEYYLYYDTEEHLQEVYSHDKLITLENRSITHDDEDDGGDEDEHDDDDDDEYGMGIVFIYSAFLEIILFLSFF